MRVAKLGRRRRRREREAATSDRPMAESRRAFAAEKASPPEASPPGKGPETERGPAQLWPGANMVLGSVGAGERRLLRNGVGSTRRGREPVDTDARSERGGASA